MMLVGWLVGHAHVLWRNGWKLLLQCRIVIDEGQKSQEWGNLCQTIRAGITDLPANAATLRALLLACACAA